MTDLRDELDAFVAEGVGPEAAELSRDEANRILRRLRQLERNRTEAVAVAKAERDRIDAWERDRCETITYEAERCAAVLGDFMRAVASREHLRTLELPNGTLRLRSPRPSLAVTDDELFMAWVLPRVGDRLALADGVTQTIDALMAEPLLRVKIEPARNEITKATKPGPVQAEADDLEHLLPITDDGESIPGVLYERSTRDAFSFVLAKQPEASHDVDEPTQQEDE